MSVGVHDIFHEMIPFGPGHHKSVQGAVILVAPIAGTNHDYVWCCYVSLTARCGLQGLGVRGPGPMAVAEVTTNMQPPLIDQLIDNVTSSFLSCHPDVDCVWSCYLGSRVFRMSWTFVRPPDIVACDTMSWFPDSHT